MEQNNILNKLSTGKYDQFGKIILENDLVKTSQGVFLCNMSDMIGRIYEKIDKSN